VRNSETPLEGFRYNNQKNTEEMKRAIQTIIRVDQGNSPNPGTQREEVLGVFNRGRKRKKGLPESR